MRSVNAAVFILISSVLSLQSASATIGFVPQLRLPKVTKSLNKNFLARPICPSNALPSTRKAYKGALALRSSQKDNVGRRQALFPMAGWVLGGALIVSKVEEAVAMVSPLQVWCASVLIADVIKFSEA